MLDFVQFFRSGGVGRAWQSCAVYIVTAKEQKCGCATWLFPLSPGPLAYQTEAPTCMGSFLPRLMLPGNILRHTRCVIYFSLKTLSVQ